MAPLRPCVLGILLLLVAALPACGGGGVASEAPYVQTLSAILPGEGTTLGGTVVVLRGTGFLHPDHQLLGIRIGSQTVLDWQIVDDTEIRLVTPPGALGLAPLWVYGENSALGDGVVLAAGYRYVAPVVYAVDDASAAQPQLYRIDVDSGNAQLVGSTDFGVRAMARDAEGVLWGVEGAPLFRLIRIDPDSAVGTPTALLRYAGTEDPVDVRDVAFHGDRLVGRTSFEELVEIDPLLGDCMVLATVPGAGAGAGLAPTGTGRLFVAPADAADPLRTWDEGLGSFQTLVPLAPPEVLVTLTHSAGLLYGCLQGPGGPELVRVDLGTGLLLPVASLPSFVNGIARDR